MKKIFMPTVAYIWKCPKCGQVLAAGQGQKTRATKAHKLCCPGPLSTKPKWTEFEGVFYLGLRFKSFPNSYLVGGSDIIQPVGDAAVECCECEKDPWIAFLFNGIKALENEIRYPGSKVPAWRDIGHDIGHFDSKEKACKACKDTLKSQASAAASQQTQTSDSAASPGAR
jgi:hypothetical protein